MTKKIFASLLLCLSLICTAYPIQAQTGADTPGDTLTKMDGEGWRVVQDGVLQRTLKPGEIETFVTGAAGFTWKLRDLRKQLQVLQAQFKVHPTPELRKAIANHRKEIANTRKVIDLAKASEEGGVIDPPKTTCSITFSYAATAGYGTSAQGTWGNSSATFSGNCGFTGEVYAYSFAKTTVNGAPVTHTVTDGPRPGASVSASAYATVNGGSPCESNSYASMTSYNLNPSSYSMQATNTSCTFVATYPAPTVSVTSSQPASFTLFNDSCRTITWTANVSGGTPTVTTKMYLNNSLVANGTSYSLMVCGDYSNSSYTLTLRADVTDGIGRTATASHNTTVTNRYFDECGGGICP